MIKLIVARGKGGLIGRSDGKMAGHVPAELAFFRKKTMGHALLMGGVTARNLPRKLEGRELYVLTSKTAPYADKIVHNLMEAKALLETFRHSRKILWIAGGKQIYQLFYREASELIISQVYANAVGDVYWKPRLQDGALVEVKSFPDFSVNTYEQRAHPKEQNG